MKLPRARRELRKRLAYLNAKLAAGESPPIERERDALDLALRMLGWRDDEDVELAEASERAARVVVPAEHRDRARASRGDELRGHVELLVVGAQRAMRIA